MRFVDCLDVHTEAAQVVNVAAPARCGIVDGRASKLARPHEFKQRPFIPAFDEDGLPFLADPDSIVSH